MRGLGLLFALLLVTVSAEVFDYLDCSRSPCFVGSTNTSLYWNGTWNVTNNISLGQTLNYTRNQLQHNSSVTMSDYYTITGFRNNGVTLDHTTNYTVFPGQNLNVTTNYTFFTVYNDTPNQLLALYSFMESNGYGAEYDGSANCFENVSVTNVNSSQNLLTANFTITRPGSPGVNNFHWTITCNPNCACGPSTCPAGGISGSVAASKFVVGLNQIRIDYAQNCSANGNGFSNETYFREHARYVLRPNALTPPVALPVLNFSNQFGIPVSKTETTPLTPSGNWSKNVTVIGTNPNGLSETTGQLTNATFNITLDDTTVIGNETLRVYDQRIRIDNLESGLVNWTNFTGFDCANIALTSTYAKEGANALNLTPVNVSGLCTMRVEKAVDIPVPLGLNNYNLSLWYSVPCLNESVYTDPNGFFTFFTQDENNDQYYYFLKTETCNNWAQFNRNLNQTDTRSTPGAGARIKRFVVFSNVFEDFAPASSTNVSTYLDNIRLIQLTGVAGNLTNITPASASSTCDSATPTYSLLTVDEQPWYVCKKDTNSNGIFDFFKVTAPSLSERTLEVGGTTNFSPSNTSTFTVDTVFVSDSPTNFSINFTGSGSGTCQYNNLPTSRTSLSVRNTTSSVSFTNTSTSASWTCNLAATNYTLTYGLITTTSANFTNDTTVFSGQYMNFSTNVTGTTVGTCNYTGLPQNRIGLNVRNATSSVSFANGTTYAQWTCNLTATNYTVEYQRPPAVSDGFFSQASTATARYRTSIINVTENTVVYNLPIRIQINSTNLTDWSSRTSFAARLVGKTAGLTLNDTANYAEIIVTTSFGSSSLHAGLYLLEMNWTVPSSGGTTGTTGNTGGGGGGGFGGGSTFNISAPFGATVYRGASRTFDVNISSLSVNEHAGIFVNAQNPCCVFTFSPNNFTLTGQQSRLVQMTISPFSSSALRNYTITVNATSTQGGTGSDDFTLFVFNLPIVPGQTIISANRTSGSPLTPNIREIIARYIPPSLLTSAAAVVGLLLAILFYGFVMERSAEARRLKETGETYAWKVSTFIKDLTRR